MAQVNILNIKVLDNPSTFDKGFRFEVTFECLKELPEGEDLNWKVVYVGSADSQDHDQELEDVDVGPVPVGTNRFVLETDAPELDQIPDEDVLGVTVLLVKCSFKDQEFVRVGYFVNNTWVGETKKNEAGEDVPSAPLTADKIERNILADSPRVTRYPCDWS